ncbi:GEVED domain-containing protein [Hymenobacter humi]|uniref:GEVED domain-containing protein n=1 Tax=Hymenobacter humi TaxID=1411620 RepID=A0ABW2UB58_9BACT
MTSVSIANAQPAYNNITANAPGGYGNFTGQPITVVPGSQLNLRVVTNVAVAHRTAVWVDWNTNGIFDAFELVVNDVTFSGPNAGTFTASFAVPARTSPSTPACG